MEFSRDGTRLVTCSDDALRQINVWQLPSGQLLGTLFGHRDCVTSVSLSPDGRILASAAGRYDGTIKLWDMSSYEEIVSVPGHNTEAAIVAFSPDGRMLVSKGQEWTVDVWDVVRRE